MSDTHPSPSSAASSPLPLSLGSSPPIGTSSSSSSSSLAHHSHPLPPLQHEETFQPHSPSPSQTSLQQLTASGSGAGSSHPRSSSFRRQNSSEASTTLYAVSNTGTPTSGGSGESSRPRSMVFPLSDTDEETKKKAKDLKLKKADYQKAKQARVRAASTFGDDSENIQMGWLKMRGVVKNWTKYFCVLRPGALLYYKDEKRNEWSGSVLLHGSEIIERPTKKSGFCFKIYHPLENSIYSTRGPKGELGIVIPIHSDQCILRAANETEGKRWMTNIELASVKPLGHHDAGQGEHLEHLAAPAPRDHRKSEFFDDDDDDDGEFGDAHSSPDTDQLNASTSSDSRALEGTPSASLLPPVSSANVPSDNEDEEDEEEIEQIGESPYVPDTPKEINIGTVTEELGDESKSLLWQLLKQVRPGMDLSKVVLPTFILEPRSFLDKLSDYYYHVDILAEAANHPDPVGRMVLIVKWFLSGFYAQPKGVKKPYNPIIGETFRCMFKHPNDTNTLFLAEQVSHHPPISAWYASNRKEGFCINGSLLTRSKFYGTSAASIMEGYATIHFLNFGEEYVVTFPLAQVKGFVIPPLVMEMGGNPTITCKQSGIRAEIEFKLKPMLGGECNLIKGKIKDASDQTLHTISGRWDNTLDIVDQNNRTSSLWVVDSDAVARRLPRYRVTMDSQGEFESEKLWKKVTEAIEVGDQYAATQEKTILEENQRKVHKDLKANNAEWDPKFFRKSVDGQWVYKYMDKKKWNPAVDAREYESNGIFLTIPASSAAASAAVSKAGSSSLSARSSSGMPASALKTSESLKQQQLSVTSGSSSSMSPPLVSVSHSQATSSPPSSPLLHPGASGKSASAPVAVSVETSAALHSGRPESKKPLEELLHWKHETSAKLETLTTQLGTIQQQLSQQQRLLQQQANAQKSSKAPASNQALLLNAALLLLMIAVQVFIQFRGRSA